MGEFDTIVVGAGSAGAIVARRLAEDPARRVLLLEGGGTDQTRFVRVPGMVSIIHTEPAIKKKFDWGYYTVPQKHAANRKIPATRGKVLGGSSSINGMLFVRGHRANFDGWAADGAPGWGFDDVLSRYKRLEDWEGGADAYRGAGGPIAVTRQKALTGASLAFMDALAAASGTKILADYNGEEQEGVSVFQQSVKDGVRFNSTEGYLRNLPEAPNLEVMTGATVARVVLEGTRAVGVELIEGKSRRVVRASREVVVAAGVFGTPQILMLSGIGPAAHLRELGIAVAADLPVGDNLHDHLFVPMTFLAKSAVHRGTAMHFFAGMLAESIWGDSWFGRTVFEPVGFLRTRFARGPAPDMQIHGLPWSYPSPNQDAPVRPVVDGRPALTVMPTLIYPKSRGTVRLASADPTAAPLIDPAFLAEPDDAELLLDGVKLMRDVMARPDMAKVTTGELHPGSAFFDDAAMRRELPTRVHSVYHGVGTCRMGSDERAVVDPKLRVRGIEGLRVADASIMPTITGGNTNAPSMLIGEMCADFVREG